MTIVSLLYNTALKATDHLGEVSRDNVAHAAIPKASQSKRNYYSNLFIAFLFNLGWLWHNCIGDRLKQLLQLEGCSQRYYISIYILIYCTSVLYHQ